MKLPVLSKKRQSQLFLYTLIKFTYMDTKCFSNPCDMKKLPIFGVHHEANIRGGGKNRAHRRFYMSIQKAVVEREAGVGRCNTSTPLPQPIS